jgi:vacuolar-type H+-ATPase subunit E/Vma4
MALADLIARLELEAQERVRAIQEKTDAEVRAIEDSTEEAMAQIMTRQFEREREDRGRVRQRELAMARRQARTRELEALHVEIARILNRARGMVPEIAASPSYVGAVTSHLEEALSFLNGLQPRVRCQAAVATVLQSAIDRHVGAQLLIDDSVGPGFVAEAADGSVLVDNTIVARLARAETSLAIALARKLTDGCH